jgi:DNA processing protein
MNSINTLQGILFRLYLTKGHFRLIHTSHQAGSDDFQTEAYQKAAGCTCPEEMKEKISQAKDQTMQALTWAASNNIRVLPFTHPDYPENLFQKKDCSPLLFINGQLPKKNLAAVVGTRNPSPLAKTKVSSIVQTLVRHQLGILSGLALGIDSLAHEYALMYGGYTLAILPRSLDNIYPKENQALADRILEAGGGLISELPPGLEPVFNPFVFRNRIQAALSQYVLPVEMGLESGTEYTVQYGIKFKKSVIACLPNKEEIDHYLPHHEGLLPAIKKYKPTGQLQVIHHWSQLGSALNAPTRPQSSLF